MLLPSRALMEAKGEETQGGREPLRAGKGRGEGRETDDLVDGLVFVT